MLKVLATFEMLALIDALAEYWEKCKFTNACRLNHTEYVPCKQTLTDLQAIITSRKYRLSAEEKNPQ